MNHQEQPASAALYESRPSPSAHDSGALPGPAPTRRDYFDDSAAEVAHPGAGSLQAMLASARSTSASTSKDSRTP
jgi:hypothetical protein